MIVIAQTVIARRHAVRTSHGLAMDELRADEAASRPPWTEIASSLDGMSSRIRVYDAPRNDNRNFNYGVISTPQGNVSAGTGAIGGGGKLG